MSTTYVRGAALYCQNKRFWLFLSVKTGRAVTNTSDAAALLRELCGISSRRELAYNYSARSMYSQLVREYNDYLRSQRGAA
ncbi:hypothetical protein AAA63_004416 [Salmonella enterica subsp. enterica]|nr:hypothetical protein [Salmonella enterica subsp. enterica serovar Poona]